MNENEVKANFEHYTDQANYGNPTAKPTFAEGEKVSFDMGSAKGTGYIRGKSIEYILDFWIVEVEASEGIDKDYYPWSCISVQHTFLKKV